MRPCCDRGFERSCRSAHCIEVDLASEQALAQACETLRARYGGRLAAVVHLAAFYAFSDEPDPRYDEVNVGASRKLLQALQGFEVEQFVYASTMLVHAPATPGQPIDEGWPLRPAWPYPQSKLAAEAVVQAERGAIPGVILRIAGVYTEMCELPSLAYQIQRIYERQMVSRVFPGDMSHGQAMVHLDDVARAFGAAIERRAQLPPLSTFLIGEPVTESYQALQNLIGRLVHGEPWETRQIPKPVAATGAWLQDKMEEVIPDAIDGGAKPFIKPFMVQLADAHYELDIGRAEQLLGWRPQHSLRRSLPAIVGALRQDPARWYAANKIELPLWLQAAPGAGASASLIADYHALERNAHRQTLWCHFANVALGLWLISSPFVFGMAQHWLQALDPVSPNGRGLAYSDTWMTASDIVSGVLIVGFGLLSLARDAGWARWSVAAVGLWLLFAPLLFWTPSAAAYGNDTLVGALVIVLAVAIPVAPGINPIARVTGPDAWPVADAGLGATVYVIEIITGVIGDKRRWRCMPWLVLLFGILIVPLGVVSVFFIIIQPIVIGTWCTLCLVGALAMLLQIPYSLDEILATLQFLQDRRRQGIPLWFLLLHGDTMAGGSADDSDNFEAPAGAVLREMLSSGIALPWTLVLSTALGVVLMCTRLLFGTSGPAADSDHVVGALVVTFSIIAWSDVARPVRLINIGFGGWLVVAPSLLSGYSSGAALASVGFGIALIGLAIPAGSIRTRMGAWDRIARFRLHLAGHAR